MSTTAQPMNKTTKKKDITDIQLTDMLTDGLTQQEIATKLGISRQAVNKRAKRLKGKVTGAIVAKKIQKVADHQINAMEQLVNINNKANELLEAVEQKPELAVKIMAEIRGQLKLQLDIFQALFDIKAIREFQDAVLQAIGEVSPDVRRSIIAKLNQQRAIRAAVKFS